MGAPNLHTQRRLASWEYCESTQSFRLNSRKLWHLKGFWNSTKTSSLSLFFSQLSSVQECRWNKFIERQKLKKNLALYFWCIKSSSQLLTFCCKSLYRLFSYQSQGKPYTAAFVSAVSILSRYCVFAFNFCELYYPLYCRLPLHNLLFNYTW